MFANVPYAKFVFHVYFVQVTGDDADADEALATAGSGVGTSARRTSSRLMPSASGGTVSFSLAGVPLSQHCPIKRPRYAITPEQRAMYRLAPAMQHRGQRPVGVDEDSDDEDERIVQVWRDDPRFEHLYKSLLSGLPNEVRRIVVNIIDID